MSSEIYIPPSAANTKDIDIAQRRILLCGEVGDGKTFTSMTTSPNPILVDFDNGVTDPRLVSLGIPHIRIYDSKYCKEVLKKDVRCNALKEFLKTDGPKFARNQTLIIDSLSSLQDDVLEYNWSVAKKIKVEGSQEMQEDTRDWWYKNKEWWVEIFTYMMRLNCHVILTAHLAEKIQKIKNSESELMVGFGPMVSGSVRHEIGRFFTDVIKQHTISKKVGDKIITEYLWQVKPDPMFKTKCRAQTDSINIPASFNGLLALGQTK